MIGQRRPLSFGEHASQYGTISTPSRSYQYRRCSPVDSPHTEQRAVSAPPRITRSMGRSDAAVPGSLNHLPHIPQRA